MNDNISLTQKAAPGAKDNTFIGTQVIHQGLTPQDAAQLAIDMFVKHFPALKEEALKEVRTIVEEELKKIPTDNIMPPSAKITIPTLHNASITEESNLREMYGKLLASDMDKQKKQSVHPAYVEIINQMSSDDAELFAFIRRYNNSIPVASVSVGLKGPAMAG